MRISFPELTFCVNSYPSFFPSLLLLQWHVKDPSHSAKSAGGTLYLNTHTSFIQRSWSGLTVLSRHNMGTYQGNELTHKSSGNVLQQSSRFAEPLWTDLGSKSGTGVHKLIFNWANSTGWTDSSKIFPKNPCMWGKSRHHHHVWNCQCSEEVLVFFFCFFPLITIVLSLLHYLYIIVARQK